MTIFLGLFLLFLMVVVTVLGAQRERDLLTQQIRDEGVSLAHAYALSAENALILNGAGLARVVGEAGRIPEISFISIVDPSRTVLAHSDPNHIGETVDDPTIEAALGTSIGAVDAGRTPLTQMARSPTGEEILEVVIPLVILDRVRGAIQIGLGTDLIHQAALGTSRTSLLIAVVAFLFGVAFIVVFSRSVTKPMEGLIKATDTIGAGSWDAVIPIPGDGEFSHLALAMERMRQEVASSFLQLRERTTEVEQLRRYAENILDSLPSGVVSLDLEGRIRGMNHNALTMLNLGAEPLSDGLPSEVLGRWPDLAAAFEAVAAQEGVVREVVQTGTDTSGRERNRLLRLHAASLRDACRAVIGQLVVVEDISFLRSMETRMRDAEKMAAMGELAAGVAHEVRNPLGSIRNAAQFLEGKWEESDPRGRFTRLIIGEVDRLNNLVARLLQYTQSGCPGLEVHDVRESVDQALVLAELRLATSRISLHRRNSPGDGRSPADGPASAESAVQRHGVDPGPGYRHRGNPGGRRQGQDCSGGHGGGDGYRDSGEGGGALFHHPAGGYGSGHRHCPANCRRTRRRNPVRKCPRPGNEGHPRHPRLPGGAFPCLCFLGFSFLCFFSARPSRLWPKGPSGWPC